MKINKLLGTVAICSSLLLAVSCSTKRGFESNSAPRTSLTTQEALQQAKFEKFENELLTLSSNLQAMNKTMSAADRKLFNEMIKGKYSVKDVALINRLIAGDLDDTSGLPEDEKLDIEKLRGELSAVAIQAILDAQKEVAKREKLANPNAKDNVDKKQPTAIKITSAGNKLELLGSEMGGSLVYSHTSDDTDAEGKPTTYVLSFSKDMASISDEKASDMYLNDELIPMKKGLITCIDTIACKTVSVVIVTSDVVSSPMIFTKINGDYKQLAKVTTSNDAKEVEIKGPDQVIDELAKAKRKAELIDRKIKSTDLAEQIAMGAITRDEAEVEAARLLNLNADGHAYDEIKDQGSTVYPVNPNEYNPESVKFPADVVDGEIKNSDLAEHIVMGAITREEAEKVAIERLTEEYK